MLTQTEAISVCLISRCYIYKLLRRLFGEEPTLELLYTVINDHTKNVFSIILDENQTGKMISFLTNFMEELSKNEETTLDRLKGEYTRLMIGPGELYAPPWESVYTHDDGTIFQESMLPVRRAYFARNLRPVNFPHDADDHVALELDFMAVLSGLLHDCFEQHSAGGSTGEIERIMSDQKDFLEKHLLKWLPEYSNRMQAFGKSLFYQELTKLTCTFLEADAAFLDDFITSEQMM